MRSDRHDLDGKSWLEGGKQFFPKGGVKHWEGLPGDVMEFVFRESFKTQLDKLVHFNSCEQKGTFYKYRAQNC